MTSSSDLVSQSAWFASREVPFVIAMILADGDGFSFNFQNSTDRFCWDDVLHAPWTIKDPWTINDPWTKNSWTQEPAERRQHSDRAF